jgi:putative endonuclease
MPTARRRLGDGGEEVAAAFLQRQGFRVVARNWHCRFGELDLVVERAGEYRFVEVKTRQSLVFGDPSEAVTPAKLSRLIQAIDQWILRSPVPPTRYQLDVIAILWRPGMAPEIRWIEAVG